MYDNGSHHPSDGVLHVQVRVPGLQARYGHRAAAFSITPALTLVTIFGGEDNCYNGELLANTTVLGFGESTCMLVSHKSQAVREATQLHSLCCHSYISWL